MNSHVNDNSSAEELNRSITWQYDNAPNLVALIDMLGGFFNKSTTELWDSWKSKVNDIDTADDFGLTVWGKIMDCPRPMLTIGGEEVNLSTETYRSILKARARLLASHGTVPDYQNYIATAFDGHFIVKDGNDMGLTFVATDDATAEEIALSDQFPEIAFLWPDGVRDSYKEPEGMFGFLGSDGIPTFDKVRVGKSYPYAPYVEFVLAEKEDGDSRIWIEGLGQYLDPISIVYMTSNDDEWKDYTIGTNIIISEIGDWIRFRAKDTNENFSNETNHYRFRTKGKYYCNGDVKYLLDKDGNRTSLRKSYIFSHLFAYAKIISAPRLSFSELTINCYYAMFLGCAYLREAQELPATILAKGCYLSMFADCTSLINTPELPATTMAEQCYRLMFADCKSLTKFPELPATTLANYCYTEMFSGCTSLTKAPELPATTLANYCYRFMFAHTSVNNIKIHYTGNFSGTDNSFNNWVNDVPASGDFYYNGSDTTRGVSAIPVGWTVHTF